MNKEDKQEYITLLKKCLDNNSYDIAKFIEYKAKITFTLESQNYLHFAVQHNCPTIVKLLCSKNLDINAKNSKGETALWLSLNQKNKNIFKILSNLCRMMV